VRDKVFEQIRHLSDAHCADVWQSAAGHRAATTLLQQLLED
jgi:hypothetical protein